MKMGYVATVVSTVVAGVIFATSPASAAATLDQNYFADQYSAGETLGGDLGQSFTAGLSGELTSIFVGSSSAFASYEPATVKVSVYSGDGLTNLLASGTYSMSVGSTGFGFDLSGLGINVTAGSMYTFDVDSLGVGYVWASNRYGYSGGSIYSGGHANGSDLLFQTYVDTSIGASPPATGDAPAAVPEAATWAMMICGFGMVGAGLRRQRTQIRFA